MKGKTDFLRKIMKFRIRYQRGLSWFGDLKYLMGLAVFLKIYGITDLYVIPVLAVGLVWLYFVGFFDEKRGLWKIESEYQTGNINPYFTELKDKIDRIEKVVTNDSSYNRG